MSRVAFALPADIRYLRLTTKTGGQGVWVVGAATGTHPSNDPPFRAGSGTTMTAPQHASWPVALDSSYPSIVACSSGIWLGTGDSLIKFDPADGSFTPAAGRLGRTVRLRALAVASFRPFGACV